MLKLKSSNGKFDIVFESDPVVEDKAKLSGIRATSAGRRKNLEWKSKVMPKKNTREANFNRVKTSKATQLRNEKLATKYERGKKEKASPKTPTIPENAVAKNESKYNEEATSQQRLTPAATTESKNLSRRDTYTFTADPSTGVISKEELETINKRLDTKTVEPLNIPGLTSSTEKETSPNTTLESARQDAIRKKQSTPVEVYDPWGKPGAGAPMKSIDGGVRTHRNVNLIQQEKDKGKIEHKADQMKSSPRTSPRVTKSITPTKNTAGPGNRFARGQGKQQHELAELEKIRQKHLEHQQAIAAQVEEKLLQKQLEKEKKRKEEEEAEERYKKQQELMIERLEEEKRKERERQEAKMLKQKMLEEGIRKAEEEARKAKEEARRDRMKKQAEKASPTPDLSAMSPKYRRVLHGDNDAIRPSHNCDEELGNLAERNSEKSSKKSIKEETDFPEKSKFDSKIPKPKKKKAVNKDKNNSVKNKSSLEDVHDTKVLDDYLVPFHRTKTANMYAQRVTSDEEEHNDSEVEQFLNKKTKSESSEEQHERQMNKNKNKALRGKNTKKDKTVSRMSGDDVEDVHELSRDENKKKKVKELSPRRSFESDMDNANNRTSNKKTGNKKPSTSPQVNNKGKRISPQMNNLQKSEEPSASPSTKRQQEILNRLAELRAGLQQKERECYNTTWSR